jgi:hypothetical protein
VGDDNENDFCNLGPDICLHHRDGGYDGHSSDRIMKRIAELRSRTAVSSAASLRYAAFLVLGFAFLAALWATVHTHRLSTQARSAEAVPLPAAIAR